MTTNSSKPVRRFTEPITAKTTATTHDAASITGSAQRTEAARRAQPWTWTAAERRARFADTLHSLAVENHLSRRETSDLREKNE